MTALDMSAALAPAGAVAIPEFDQLRTPGPRDRGGLCRRRQLREGLAGPHRQKEHAGEEG